MTAWLFDLGNTRLKCAPLQADGTRGPVRAIAHGDSELGAAVADALPAGIDTAYVASVASAAQRVALLDALARRCRRITLARTQARLGAVSVAYATPARLGVDRFLALLDVHDSNRPVLVCGVGTALTVDLLLPDGRHAGGLIAPSPDLMRDALHGRAPHLPALGGRRQAFADDTDDALASGCEGAAIALVERSLDQARLHHGQPPTLVIHGGGAAALLDALPQATLREHLVLDGLARWAALTA